MCKYSKRKIAVLMAYERGYRILENGDLHNPKFDRILEGYLEKKGAAFYKTTTIIGTDNIRYKLSFHQLAAYQKYGKDLFKDGVVVRHLDGDSQNNQLGNISIGSYQDNMLDREKEDIKHSYLNAASKCRQLTDIQVQEVKELYAQGHTKEVLANKYCISNFILNFALFKKYKTKA